MEENKSKGVPQLFIADESELFRNNPALLGNFLDCVPNKLRYVGERTDKLRAIITINANANELIDALKMLGIKQEIFQDFANTYINSEVKVKVKIEAEFDKGEHNGTKMIKLIPENLLK